MSEYLPTGKLEIYVTQYQAGPSIEDLEIIVNGARRRTDANGIATFDDFPYGSYTVTHDNPKYLPMTITAILNRYLATYRFSVAPNPLWVDPSLPPSEQEPSKITMPWWNSLDRAKDEASYATTRAWQTIVGYVNPTISNISNAVSGFGGFVASIIQGLLGSLRDIVSGAGDAFAEKTTDTFKSIASGSPDWEGDFTGTVDELAEIYQAQYRQGMEDILNAGPVDDINIFETRAKEWAVTAFKNVDMLKKWGVLAELGSLGQVEGVFNYYDWIDELDQQSATITRIHQIELEKSLLIGFEQAMNMKYNPMIPPYQDLINMRVKEVITPEKFEEYLLKQGFSSMWAGYLWTAHFEPASWTDFLTAMRRKRDVSWTDAAGNEHEHKFGDNIAADEAVIRDLSVLVDYDDRYWTFFKERMYNDLTVREARWLLETGDVEVSTLEDIVHRHGYRPEDEELMVKMLRTFQARPWRNRYLTGLVSAYTSGVIPQEELQTTIHDEGFQPEVYEYVVKIGDLRKRVQAAGGEEAVKEKILSLGDLKKLFLAGKLNDVELTNRLTVQGYSYEDISLLIGLLNDQKIVEAVGKAPLELSVSELLNAFRYTEISEDTLRARLMLKGMSLADVQILINTKRKQWGVGKVPGEYGYEPPTAG